jgi:hypothetical protein
LTWARTFVPGIVENPEKLNDFNELPVSFFSGLGIVTGKNCFWHDFCLQGSDPEPLQNPRQNAWLGA